MKNWPNTENDSGGGAGQVSKGDLHKHKSFTNNTIDPGLPC